MSVRATLRIILLLVVVVTLAVLLAGCRPASQAPASPGMSAPSVHLDPQQQRLTSEILSYLKERETSLEELREEIRQLRTREEDPGGVKALREDVRVAKALIGAARKAASAKSGAQTAQALQRLVPALIALRGNLPAARITQELERALQAISTYQAEESINVASRSLLRATDIAVKAPPTLAPTLIKEIESAKGQVDKQDLARAGSSILEVLERLGNDESLQSADRVLAGAQGATQALGQEAWPVVTAQLDFIDTLLSSLQQKIEGAMTTVTPAPELEAAEEVPATEEPVATEAEGVREERAAESVAPRADPGPQLPPPRGGYGRRGPQPPHPGPPPGR